MSFVKYRVKEVASDFGVAGVLAGHKCRSGWSANWASSVCLGESDTLSCHRIKSRGADLLLSVCAQITVSQVVAEDEQDVGLLLLVAAGGHQ